MKKENQVNQSRRDLLKGLGTAAVAGAVVAGVSTQTVASESSTESKEPLKKAITKLNTFVITTTRYRSQPDETHQTFRQRDQRAKSARY